ncbi:MFS transporter [Gryllotalpicola kribbensis]|uniref:MFS transporter n=1 Tax=Gryllotalpicola kribbensis TaxID=993084 RepID=A0ABP8AWI6_9MICO
MTLSGVLIDVRPLRESAALRRLWAGNAVSGFGGTMASFTVSWVVWDRTHSAVALGAIGVAQLVPMIVFTLLGGHWADRYERRRLIIGVRWAQLAASAALAAVVITTTREVAWLYPLIAVQTALGSINQPATQSFIATLLGPQLRGAAFALNQSTGQVSMLIGPLLGGVVLALWGPGWALGFDAASFLAALYGVLGLPRTGRPGSEAEGAGDAAAAAPPSAIAQIAAGIRFVTRTPIVAALLLADLNATVLAMPVALFPVLNSERFGGSPATLGLLTPALGLGGVLAGFLSGRITRAKRQGLVMVVASAVWGAAIAGAGLVPNLAAVLVLLAVTGAADVASVVSRATIIQAVTPDAYRGRVNSLDYLVGAGGPKLGDLRAGLVADVSSGWFSMAIGGAVSAVLAVVIAASVPSLRRYRTG